MRYPSVHSSFSTRVSLTVGFPSFSYSSVVKSSLKDEGGEDRGGDVRRRAGMNLWSSFI